MNNDLAKQTMVTLVSNSSFFRGMLFAKEAWGYNGFPSSKESDKLNNLKSLLREIADSLEEKSYDEKAIKPCSANHRGEPEDFDK